MSPTRAVAVLAVLAAALLLGASSASAVTDPLRVGPNQSFVGLVNGSSVRAGTPVYVACPGPRAFGHPIRDRVSIGFVPRQPFVGFTGSLGNHIAVVFVGHQSVPIDLTFYGQAEAVPATLSLPCHGIGQVRFSPLPTSPTARPYVVWVRFVGLGV